MAGVAAACLSGATAADAAFRIDSPTLEPGFRGKGTSYVVECRRPVRIAVRTDRRGSARIGAGRAFRGRHSRRVPLEAGQAIRVIRRRGGEVRRRYSVRCLPDDFPAYRYVRIRRPNAGPFMVTPYNFNEPDPNYAIVFDRFGAPIWWYQGKSSVIDAKVLGNGLIAVARYTVGGYAKNPSSRYDLRRPNGSRESSLQTVDAITDIHDLQPTADGNYLVLAYKPRADPIDTSEFNGDASADVIDAVVQKLTPDGKLLWEWNSKDHISLAETGRWWDGLEEPYDLVHINAVEPTNDGRDYLISLRHTDAIYRLNGETGDVEWKLGGEPTPESLDVVDDPYGDYPFGGQHDVRQLGNGTITVHDNATNLDHPTRAVRYRIRSGTARLLDSQEDPLAPESGCCGSARWLGKSWLLSWGGTDLITEIDADGRRTFKLRIPDQFSYRAIPVHGRLSAAALRRGMDQRVPRAR